jgi:hypothetical protein
MSKPRLTLVRPETTWLQPNRAEVKEFYRTHAQASKDYRAREKLTRESNLTTAPRYRPCPCKCGMTILWSNPGYHPTAEDLEPEPLSAAPVETPRLRDAVSQAQVLWSRDMLAQYPHKSREQIARENHTSWEQLQHWARSSTEGLPEKAGQRKPAQQAKPVAKPESKPAPKGRKVKDA